MLAFNTYYLPLSLLLLSRWKTHFSNKNNIIGNRIFNILTAFFVHNFFLKQIFSFHSQNYLYLKLLENNKLIQFIHSPTGNTSHIPLRLSSSAQSAHSFNHKYVCTRTENMPNDGITLNYRNFTKFTLFNKFNQWMSTVTFNYRKLNWISLKPCYMTKSSLWPSASSF